MLAIDGATASISTPGRQSANRRRELNFGWSHGALGLGLPTIQSRARLMRSSRSFANSVTSPIASALAGAMSAPSAQICNAAWIPTSRGSRVVPPPPGSSPA